MSMAEKKKDGLIAWENLIIAGGGLLDVGNKINEAKPCPMATGNILWKM